MPVIVLQRAGDRHYRLVRLPQRRHLGIEVGPYIETLEDFRTFLQLAPADLAGAGRISVS